MAARLLREEKLSKDLPSFTTTATTRAMRNGGAGMEKALSNQEDLGGDRGMTDDIFDESYCEKEGPKPARRYVWRNIVLMSLLHLGALYGLWLIPAAKPVTLVWAQNGPTLKSTAAGVEEVQLEEEKLQLEREKLPLEAKQLADWYQARAEQEKQHQHEQAEQEPQRARTGPCTSEEPGTEGSRFLCFLLSALGITAGAHRIWSHRSYKASLPLRIFLAIANSMAFQNDIYEWARDHRVHHKFSEMDADPHNATRGFFFSHVGWLLVRKHPDVIEKGRKLDMADLKADKVVMFQRRFYKLSVVAMCFLFPTLVPWCFWGESLRNSFFLPAILRYVLVLNATWLVNSAAHMFGNRPYDRNINPRENRLVTFGALGEGFHNYHHTFPYDYSTSEFGWHYNFTTAFIDLMCLLGLASDRKKVSKETILARKIRTGDGSHNG